MDPTYQQPTINDIRNRLRQRSSGHEVPPVNSYSAPQPTYQAQPQPAPQFEYPPHYNAGQSQAYNSVPTFSDGPGVIRETSMLHKMSNYKPGGKFKIALEKIEWICAAFTVVFVLYFFLAPEGLKLPGSEGIGESASSGIVLFVALFTAFIVYRFVRRIKSSANHIHSIRNVRQKTPAFKIGVALGAALFFYGHFNPPLVEHMINPPSFMDNAKNLIGMPLLKLAAYAGIGGIVVQKLYYKWLGEDEPEDESNGS